MATDEGKLSIKLLLYVWLIYPFLWYRVYDDSNITPSICRWWIILVLLRLWENCPPREWHLGRNFCRRWHTILQKISYPCIFWSTPPSPARSNGFPRHGWSRAWPRTKFLAPFQSSRSSLPTSQPACPLRLLISYKYCSEIEVDK
jgi:hypothetical protein